MKILKDNLPWVAPTLAILAVGGLYLDHEGALPFNWGRAEVAAPALRAEAPKHVFISQVVVWRAEMLGCHKHA